MKILCNGIGFRLNKSFIFAIYETFIPCKVLTTWQSPNSKINPKKQVFLAKSLIYRHSTEIRQRLSDLRQRLSDLRQRLSDLRQALRTSDNHCPTSDNDCRTSDNDCPTSDNDCRTSDKHPEPPTTAVGPPTTTDEYAFPLQNLPKCQLRSLRLILKSRSIRRQYTLTLTQPALYYF
ncbi:MAG: hypothetical protein KA792_01160 [Bacteroidales bacterium]|nr:hypothetical protein [Bacteroidales bacterium]